MRRVLAATASGLGGTGPARLRLRAARDAARVQEGSGAGVPKKEGETGWRRVPRGTRASPSLAAEERLILLSVSGRVSVTRTLVHARCVARGRELRHKPVYRI